LRRKIFEAHQQEEKRKLLDANKQKKNHIYEASKEDLNGRENEKCNILKKLIEYVKSANDITLNDVNAKKTYIASQEEDEQHKYEENANSIIADKKKIVSKQQIIDTMKKEANKKQEEFNSMIEMTTESSQQKKKIKDGAIEEISKEIQALQDTINKKIQQREKYEDEIAICDQEINIFIFLGGSRWYA